MNRFSFLLTTMCAALLFGCNSTAGADGGARGSRESFAEVNGVRLRYTLVGEGSPVVLLHGYTQTGHMWNPLVDELAKNHTVLVPDLRGAGGSQRTESGYDKKNMAVDIHELDS